MYLGEIPKTKQITLKLPFSHNRNVHETELYFTKRCFKAKVKHLRVVMVWKQNYILHDIGNFSHHWFRLSMKREQMLFACVTISVAMKRTKIVTQQTFLKALYTKAMFEMLKERKVGKLVKSTIIFLNYWHLTIVLF